MPTFDWAQEALFGDHLLEAVRDGSIPSLWAWCQTLHSSLPDEERERQLTKKTLVCS